MPSRPLLAVLAFVLPLAAVSCDDRDADKFTAADFPSCQPQSMRLVGTVEGLAIDVTLPGAGGGLTQGDDGGSFQYQGDSSSDPNHADLRLTWSRLTKIGDVVAAQGTLHLAEGPLAGKTFCLGAGTEIRMPGDGTVIQFELAGLASGNGCTVALTGSIRGCMR